MRLLAIILTIVVGLGAAVQGAAAQQVPEHGGVTGQIMRDVRRDGRRVMILTEDLYYCYPPTGELYKVPGVSETIDWAAALTALDRDSLDAASAEETIGVLLKAKEDIEAVRGVVLAKLIARS